MGNLQDFFMDEFEDAEAIEKVVMIGGKEKNMQFKPISAAKGDELRKSCRRITHHKGVKQVETDQDAFLAKLIIETTIFPDFKSKELQDHWGVLGADHLLAAMKSKMRDGEYAQLADLVSDINGYDRSMNDMIDEVKN